MNELLRYQDSEPLVRERGGLKFGPKGNLR
jgi:hypothetical protein